VFVPISDLTRSSTSLFGYRVFFLVVTVENLYDHAPSGVNDWVHSEINRLSRRCSDDGGDDGNDADELVILESRLSES